VTIGPQTKGHLADMGWFWLLTRTGGQLTWSNPPPSAPQDRGVSWHECSQRWRASKSVPPKAIRTILTTSHPNHTNHNCPEMAWCPGSPSALTAVPRRVVARALAALGGARVGRRQAALHRVVRERDGGGARVRPGGAAAEGPGACA